MLDHGETYFFGRSGMRDRLEIFGGGSWQAAADRLWTISGTAGLEAAELGPVADGSQDD
jgi:hypothetical protein